jgi:hypothetical protein
MDRLVLTYGQMLCFTQVAQAVINYLRLNNYQVSEVSTYNDMLD